MHVMGLLYPFTGAFLPDYNTIEISRLPTSPRVSVCLYLCMYVYMYVCIYIYIYACMYVCMYVCVFSKDLNLQHC